MQPWAAVSGLRSTVLVLVGLVLVWELAVRGLDLQPILLPAPSRIAVELASAPWFYIRQSGDTLMTTLAGFVLAVCWASRWRSALFIRGCWSG